MRIFIENSFLKVVFDTHGAETVSVFDKHKNTEILWQGDSDSYPFHSPNCFPFTGRLKDGTYQYDGKEYHLPLHGFAKDSEFSITKQTKSSVTFLLTDTPQTLKSYPFKFHFYIQYKLNKNRLTTLYRIKNIDDKPIYFGVGGHPGFILPSKEDAFGTHIDGNKLVFQHKEHPVQIVYDPDEILIKGQKLYGSVKEILLYKSLFSVDALLFTNLKSKYVVLQKSDGTAIKFWFNDCPYLAFWSHKTHGEFICFEPWFGLPDYYNPIRELKAKEGINCLSVDAEFQYKYQIEIL